MNFNFSLKQIETLTIYQTEYIIKIVKYSFEVIDKI